MNNDISSELTSYINPRTKQAAKRANTASQIQNDKIFSSESYEAAQKYYDALGHAKVNMDKNISNSIIDSIDILKNDPEYVQNYVDFCDAIQQEGYSLEDAVIGTDIIFEKLKDESIYRP